MVKKLHRTVATVFRETVTFLQALPFSKTLILKISAPPGAPALIIQITVITGLHGTWSIILIRQTF
jgi:hypothetical protein